MRFWYCCIILLSLSLSSMNCNEVDDEEDTDSTIETDTTTNEEPIIPKSERPEFIQPKLKSNVNFVETFLHNSVIDSIWIKSQAKKDGADDAIAKYDGEWMVEEGSAAIKNDLALHLKSKAKHQAIAAKLKRPFIFDGSTFIAQYEIKFQNGQECGGGYIKLLSETPNLDLSQFMDKTPYTIMFGPDKCGSDEKLHFIIRHKNPKTGEFEEKHAKKPQKSFDFIFDKKTHLLRLVITPDNNFQIFADNNLINSGSLLEDLEPAINPPKTIVDPDDHKPEDWDEREKIPDPTATKPEEWDESQPEKIDDVDAIMPDGWLVNELELISDPTAEKPADWDNEMDGEWEAPQINNPLCESAPGCGEWKRPMIDNPSFKGKWRAPQIDNPDYRGKWEPRKIENPNYFEDKEPYKMTTIQAIGLELWSMSDNIIFDNFLINDDLSVADDFVKQTFLLKSAQELAGDTSGESVFGWLLKAAEERKWLYAVYIMVILLPVVLLSVWCCPNSGPGLKKSDITKKTDENTEDDKINEETEDALQEADKESVTEKESNKDLKETILPKSRSDLEATVTEPDDKDSKSEEADLINNEGNTSVSPTTRKRKPRKE